MGAPSPRLARGWATPSWGLAFRLPPGLSRKKEGCQTIAVKALGALQSVLRQSWEQGFGGQHSATESFHWIDMPGSAHFLFGQPPAKNLDPLGEQANPHLRHFVNALLGLNSGAGKHFLENLNLAMSIKGAKQDPHQAMLIGRPLALVRACLRLEPDGQTALSQGFEAQSTGGVENLQIPVRLGGRRRVEGAWQGEDGLVP